MKSLKLLIVFVTLGIPVAHAEPRSSDVDALLNHGVDLREKGDDAGALEQFRKAYAISRSPKALAQTALAEQALGQWLTSEKDLQTALAATIDPWISKNRRALEKALRTIEGHLGWIELSGVDAGVSVTIDNLPVTELPMPRRLRVQAGQVVVLATANGMHNWSRTVLVKPGQTARESVVLVPLAVEPTSATAVTPPAVTQDSSPVETPLTVTTTPDAPYNDVGNTHKTYALVTAIAAGLSLGTGVVFHSIRQSARADFQNDPACGTAAPDKGGAACAASYDRANTAMVWAIGGYSAAAALAGLSAYLFYSGGSEIPANQTASSCGFSFALAQPGVNCVGSF